MSGNTTITHVAPLRLLLRAFPGRDDGVDRRLRILCGLCLGGGTRRRRLRNERFSFQITFDLVENRAVGVVPFRFDVDDERQVMQFARIVRFQDADRVADRGQVRGVIARAFHTVSHEQLELFCSQLVGGGDHPCRATIDPFVSCLQCWSDRRESTKREIYRRCELTLEAFLMNSADVSFSKNISELFPLPKEPR